MSETIHDPVNRPAHYIGRNGLQAIEVIEDWELGYHLATAVAYILRAHRKGNRKQDLEKALWYVRRARSQAPTGQHGAIDPRDVSAAFELGRDEAMAIWWIHKASYRQGLWWESHLVAAEGYLRDAVEAPGWEAT